MDDRYRDGICMMCLKNMSVRHINLYIIGSEGFWCCRNCEDEVLYFIRGKRSEAAEAKKRLYKKEVIL